MEESGKKGKLKQQKLLFQLGLTGVGVLVGYLYWFYYGCVNGCAITSNALYTSLYGGLLGYLLSGSVLDIFFKNKQ